MKIMTEHIPAHDCVTELYKFDELDEDIQERLVSQCVMCHADDWDGEYRDTLKELEKLFGVRCVGWSVDGWSHTYILKEAYGHSLGYAAQNAERDEDWGYFALKGNRAMGKCWTKWGDKVTKGKYYSGPCHGTLGKSFHYAHRHSKVLFVGLHDGSCPLTGVCMDNDALDPLWDIMEGKHVKDGMTIAEMIDECFEAFFTSWEKDIHYRQSEEYFRENEMAEWYDEDGNEVSVPEGAVLTDPTREEAVV